MAKKERNAFKAGLFIVTSIALIIAVIVAINGVGELVEPDQVRTATFALADDVGGVRVGDDVRVGGVKVGIVRSVKIESAGDKADPRVVVHFNMPQRLVLREGVRIGVQTTLTGGAWINFSSLGTGQPLADDRVLTGEPGFYTQLTNSIGALTPEIQGLARDLRTVTLPKVNDTAENAKQLTASLRGKIEDIVARYNTVTTRLAEALTNLRDILGDGRPDIRGALANINSVTGSLKEKLPPILDEFNGLVKKVNAELESTTGVLANLRDATGSARSLLTTNRSKLDEMIASLKAAGDNLKFATAEIRHSPWRLLYKPRPGEVANLNLYDATRQFADGANDMSDAATALRDALADPKTDKATVEALAKKLDESFAQFQQVEQDLWKRVKE